MIAAVRRRAMVARVRAETWTRKVDRRLSALLVAAPRVGTWTRAADRRLNRLLNDAWPRLAGVGRRVRALGVPWLRRAERLLRPLGARLFRLLALLERWLLRGRDLAARSAARASAVLTPRRGICLAILGAAVCLGVAQFVDYRAVEIGQPGYEGLPAASAPSVDAETAGAAHAYLLLPIALLAAALALAAMRRGKRRRLGWTIFSLGLLSLGVILLVDLPAGLDVGAEASRFSGATAVLYDGFYAEIAAAAGLMLGGGLLFSGHRVPVRHGYRPRKPSLARTQGGRRRARTSSA